MINEIIGPPNDEKSYFLEVKLLSSIKKFTPIKIS